MTSTRRVLVAVDTSRHGSTAIEAAARLATQLRAELQGLFIEDIDLLRLAGLPFASEIDSAGLLRPLDQAAMEQALRTRAAGVRQVIEAAAERTSLHWSFRISRGNLVRTILLESLEADLLVVGRESSAASAARRGPIMVIDEGSPSRNRLYETARCLAQQPSDTIVVLVTQEGVETSEQRADLPSTFYVQRCSNRVEAILQAVRQWRPQLLLIGRASELVSEANFNSLVTQLPCPLALVQ